MDRGDLFLKSIEVLVTDELTVYQGGVVLIIALPATLIEDRTPHDPPDITLPNTHRSPLHGDIYDRQGQVKSRPIFPGNFLFQLRGNKIHDHSEIENLTDSADASLDERDLEHLVVLHGAVPEVATLAEQLTVVGGDGDPGVGWDGIE